ncbi:MAG: tetratricopeptide repeat protein [Planctomycetota bacterium]
MTPEILALEKEADQLKEAGNFAEAIEKVNQALGMDENFVRGHLALAVLYYKVEEHAKAVDHAETAFKLEPDDFNAAALSVTYQRAFEATKDPIYIEKAENANTNLR